MNFQGWHKLGAAAVTFVLTFMATAIVIVMGALIWRLLGEYPIGWAAVIFAAIAAVFVYRES